MRSHEIFGAPLHVENFQVDLWVKLVVQRVCLQRAMFSHSEERVQNANQKMGHGKQ